MELLLLGLGLFALRFCVADILKRSEGDDTDGSRLATLGSARGTENSNGDGGLYQTRTARDLPVRKPARRWSDHCDGQMLVPAGLQHHVEINPKAEPKNDEPE
jgi:hypothetical protein